MQQRMELANRIAREAGLITLEFFRSGRFEVERKGDGSPLTIADQQAERHLRAEIEKRYPNDGIVGEEFGETPGSSGIRWILDPIDGTKSFISGVPLYGTMVGIEKDGIAQVGSVFFPGLNQAIFASRGQGAWHVGGDNAATRAQVSSRSQLADAVLVTSEAETFGDRGAQEVYDQLSQSVYFARTWGDAYGYMMVAIGKIEVMIDPILNVWDAAAVQPIIEESGGRFTDWAGKSRIDAGESIGSNGLVHEDVLAITRSYAGNFDREKFGLQTL